MMTEPLQYPPGPRPGWLPGEPLRAFRRDPLGFLLDQAQKFGDICSWNMRTQRAFLLNHPDFIQAVLATDQENFTSGQALHELGILHTVEKPGDEKGLHPYQPQQSHPAFEPRRIDECAEYMAGDVARQVRSWQDGQEIDIHQEMTRLVTASAARAMLDMEINRTAHGQFGRMNGTLKLFMAGHATTANALAWTWFLLAQHPEAEARLYAELEQVFSGRRPAVEDCSRLVYTRSVFCEALRLYPPVWVIGRQALADYPLGGYGIPAGATLLVSPWVMQHDARYFPEPFRFDPLRWTEQASASRPLFSFFPFGGGGGACLGEALAWKTAILLLGTLAQRWSMRPTGNQVLALQPTIPLRPRHAIRLTLAARSPNP